LTERDCVGDQSQTRGQPEGRSSGSSLLHDERCCDWLSAQSRSGREQRNVTQTIRSPALTERDCVGDQSQTRGQPEGRSSGSSPLHGERCCDWLLAQSRSGREQRNVTQTNRSRSLRRSATVSQTSRRSVASQKVGRGDRVPLHGERCCDWLLAQSRSGREQRNVTQTIRSPGAMALS